jgi:hypothetical protein
MAEKAAMSWDVSGGFGIRFGALRIPGSWVGAQVYMGFARMCWMKIKRIKIKVFAFAIHRQICYSKR